MQGFTYRAAVLHPRRAWYTPLQQRLAYAPSIGMRANHWLRAPWLRRQHVLSSTGCLACQGRGSMLAAAVYDITVEHIYDMTGEHTETKSGHAPFWLLRVKGMLAPWHGFMMSAATSPLYSRSRSPRARCCVCIGRDLHLVPVVWGWHAPDSAPARFYLPSRRTRNRRAGYTPLQQNPPPVPLFLGAHPATGRVPLQHWGPITM